MYILCCLRLIMLDAIDPLIKYTYPTCWSMKLYAIRCVYNGYIYMPTVGMQAWPLQSTVYGVSGYRLQYSTSQFYPIPQCIY